MRSRGKFRLGTTRSLLGKSSMISSRTSLLLVCSVFAEMLSELVWTRSESLAETLFFVVFRSWISGGEPQLV